jgi:flagellar hook-associated protein 2
MGTVGLSFGSPTSGTGFDVSSTVASIVSNLQNVESPWKTQLASLQAQDTAISSLGTLLSTVSTDLSQLTDFTGVASQKTGSSSDTSVLELTSATSVAQAGTHTVVVKNLATTSSGYMDQIANTADLLSGSIVLQVGSGTVKTITLDSTDDTLSGLAKAINASGVGITANVLTDSSGSRLSLVSGTSGATGNISVVSNSIVDTTNSSTAMGYTSSATGSDATLVVDGVTLTSASNTVTNLIPGLTFQILAPSAESSSDTYTPVQVLIGNDITDTYSAINQFVSDYNSLVSAIHVQQGDNASGNAEPLFGSPTLSLLQQQLMTGINTQNPTGYMDAVSASLDVTLSGSIVLQVGTGSAQTISVTSADNTLSGLASTINAANLGVTAAVTTNSGQQTLTLASQSSGSTGALSVTSSLTATSDTALSYTDSGLTSISGDDTGTLGSLSASSDLYSGSLVLQVGSTGTAQTISIDSSNNTPTTLAQAINQAGMGVTATVSSDGTSITLASTASGSAGVLYVDPSNLTDATTSASVSYNDSGYSTSTKDQGTIGTVGSSTDILSGTVVIQAGSGTVQTFSVDSSSNTISGLAAAINKANIGVTAAVNTAGTGITITSNTQGSAGAMTITSNLLDTTATSSTALSYNQNSDVNSLASLGISVSSSTDGALTLDSTTLESLLNSDFSGVVGFFQNTNSWGADFTTLLETAGTSSGTGMLALSLSSNSASESTLNADISREEIQISAERKSLTAELNSANEILQEIPAQLSEVNEIYSAITGYGQSSS